MSKILAIETSCDETALALVECERKSKIEMQNAKFKYPAKLDDFEFNIIAEEIASQIRAHQPYGGVVPMLAKREHIKNLPLLLEKIINSSSILRQPADHLGNNLGVDLIAVTVGPGLEPALWTGINFAKELGEKWKVPIVGVNHLEGHIFSNWINPIGENKNLGIEFPAIVLIVSGGHTILLKMDDVKKWNTLGETRDDAVGETFDKVAKMLGLPYPGGPEVEKLAMAGIPTAIDFARPMINAKNYDFSFSGLKTSVLYYLRDKCAAKKGVRPTTIKINNCLRKKEVADVCASFQQAAIEVLVKKTVRAAEEFNAKSVLLCGGVAANKTLQEAFKNSIDQDDGGVSFHVPELKYNTDNAVMIGAAACLGNNYPVEKALPNLNV